MAYSNLINSQPENNPNILVSPWLLEFYDSTLSCVQFYKQDSILGFEKINSTSFKIFMVGAKDVNAKDIITITHTAGMVYLDCIKTIYTGTMAFSAQVPGEPFVNANILRVITDATEPNLTPFFTSCTIVYGSCCSGDGGSRTDGGGKIVKVGTEYYMPITQTDIISNLGNRSGPGSDTGAGFNSNDLSINNWYEVMVPTGWKVTGGVIWGDGVTNRFIIYEGAINTHTITAKTTVNAVNAPADITDDGNTDIVGDGLKTALVFFENRSITENFYGGKLIVEQV